MFASFLWGSRKYSLLTLAILMALIAFADRHTAAALPLGFLYLFPMLLAGSTLSRWQIAAVAGACTFLTELFDEFPWEPRNGIPRDILYFAAFFCMGLFVHEATRSRRLAARHMHELESEMKARREAEEQLKILVDSSPAAIVTANSEGIILLANDAAHRLLVMPPESLAGKQIRDYLPALLHVPRAGEGRPALRTAMQCQGRRSDGEAFQADVWFSTYATSAGPRLAAMVVDTSEDLRTREESNLHQLLTGSRILVAAVSHEIRNVCGAIGLVHENLARNGALAGNKDFEALGNLVTTLERIAATDLRQNTNHAAGVDIRSLLEDLRIVIESSLREGGIAVQWMIPPDLPSVWADRQSLMQVFLNLTKNSERAMSDRSIRRLSISAGQRDGAVFVCITDTGGGVLHPDRLFRPFQQGAQSSGLGLYLSRAFLRTFHGDLRYEPSPADPGEEGASFLVELSPALSEGDDENSG